MIAQQSSDGQFYWVHADHLGSGRKLTRADGSVAYRGEFDPHGQAVLEDPAGGANLNSHKFTGYERDAATNLDYAAARMYHHNRGRFMQADPAGVGAANLADPQSLNRYSYVQNDPVNFVDPTGLNIAGLYLYPEFYISPAERYGSGGMVCGVDYEFRDYIDEEGARVRGFARRQIVSCGYFSGSDWWAQRPRPSGRDSSTIDEISRRLMLLESVLDEVEQFLASPSVESVRCHNAITGSAGSPWTTLTKMRKDGRIRLETPLTAGAQAGTEGTGERATMRVDASAFAQENYYYNLFGFTMAFSQRGNLYSTILHELSHATGRYSHHKDRVARGEYDELKTDTEVSEIILKDCMGGRAR